MLTQLVLGRLGETVATIEFGPRVPGVGFGLLKGSSMEKWLCWASMGVSGSMSLLFLLDVILKIPFGGLSPVVDILGLLASGMVLYLSWNAFQDVK